MTSKRQPRYPWSKRAVKMLQGLVSSEGDVAQLIERPRDASALLGVCFPAVATSVFAYSWGFMVMVGEEKQTLRFAEALVSRMTDLPIKRIHSLIYYDPLKMDEVSFVSGTGAWSRVKGPRILLALLYGVLIDLTRDEYNFHRKNRDNSPCCVCKHRTEENRTEFRRDMLNSGWGKPGQASR